MRFINQSTTESIVVQQLAVSPVSEASQVGLRVPCESFVRFLSMGKRRSSATVSTVIAQGSPRHDPGNLEARPMDPQMVTRLGMG